MAVPKLRFKDSGGREFPEWEDKKLGEFFSKINKKNNDNLITNVITNSAVNGLIEQRMFFDKDIANKENTDKYYIIEKGDFVYNPRKSNDAPYGPVHMYESDCKGIVSPLYLCFKPINKTLSLLFMKNYFKSSSWHKYIYANGDTGARDDRVSVKVTTFLDMPVNIPSLPEQQKIADFLTAYDTMIDTQTKRVEAMKTRKKGLLQKIFSQEIRFRDDERREYPEWEGKYLEKIASIYDGVHQTPNYVETGVPFVSVENINDLENTNKFISLEDFKKDFKVYPEQDDILMTRIGDIGTSALVTKEGFAYYVSLALIKTKKNAIIPKFLNQYIKSNIFQHELYKRSLQYAFPKKINKGEIGKCVVKVPSLPEQQKIADFLTAIDTQIEVEEKRLETMKTIKKGLLQQMFI